MKLPTLESASLFAQDLNHLVLFLIGISGFFILLVMSLVLFFIVKYRHSPKNPISQKVDSSTAVEVFWTAVPLAITISVFAWGAHQFFSETEPPAEAQEISVLARQWMWKFRSIGGNLEINELHLQVDQAYKLTMISQDVIHSFFVPELRLKYDVLPGRYTQVWFRPNRTGTFTILCSQYCGTDHSKMIGRLVIMTQADYDLWAQQQAAQQKVTDLEAGARLFRAHDCESCHEKQKIGPDLHGIAGSWVSLTAQGHPRAVFADDNYLRDSILNPSRDLTRGWPDVMPSFKGQLNEEEIHLLLVYLHSLAKGTA